MPGKIPLPTNSPSTGTVKLGNPPGSHHLDVDYHRKVPTHTHTNTHRHTHIHTHTHTCTRTHTYTHTVNTLRSTIKLSLIYNLYIMYSHSREQDWLHQNHSLEHFICWGEMYLVSPTLIGMCLFYSRFKLDFASS